MKKLAVLFVLCILLAYAYYDEGAGTHQKGDFRITYSSIGSKNSNSLDVSKKLTETDADVILVGDWTGNNLDPVEILSSGYKVVSDSTAQNAQGLVIFAKNDINITSMAVRSPISEPCDMPILSASLQYRDTLITILGVQVPPPVELCNYNTGKSIKYLSTLIDKGKLGRNIGVGKQGDSVIMLGDLNAMPFDKMVESIEGTGLVDAQRHAGQLIGATWAPFYWLPKLIRIDYLFSTPTLNIKKLWNTRMPGSNHSLLVADFALPMN